MLTNPAAAHNACALAIIYPRTKYLTGTFQGISTKNLRTRRKARCSGPNKIKVLVEAKTTKITSECLGVNVMNCSMIFFRAEFEESAGNLN